MVFLCFGLLIFLPGRALAQITNLSDTTSTPVPGAGHNYTGLLNETVNPANGSVSLRINLPMPPGRKLTVPFSIAYDSNGGIVLQPSSRGLGWVNETGWSYSVPMLSYSTENVALQDGSGTVCEISLDYMYSDASGGRHPLALSVYGYGPGSKGNTNCVNAILPNGNYVDNPQDTLGGDPVLLAYTPAILSGQHFIGKQVTVADADGAVVNFPGRSYSQWILPTSIEDRNGNVVTVNSGGSCAGGFSGYTDTLGRPALSIQCGNSGSGGTDTITVDGLSEPYYANYSGSATWTNTNLNVDIYYGSCGVGGLNLAYVPLSSLMLPDGTSYSFSYDPTYGLLNKIVYPTGAYVRYVWGVNSQSEAGTAGGIYPPPNNEYWSCSYYYDTPVITDRYVSYNGSTEVLHQHYSYSTTWGNSQNPGWWTSKTTTVTTYDQARGGNFQTVYSYVGIGSPPQPNTDVAVTNSIPLENEIDYYDWNANLLRKVNKAWANQYMMVCGSTSEGNLTSRVDYQYSQGAVVTDKKDWDWGQQGPCPSSLTYQPPTGTPTRETVTDYQSFAATPIFSTSPTATPSILDRPQYVYLYSNGNWAAQNSYTYDSGVSQVSATQHDDNNYPASQNTRGNLATQTRICSGCTNAVTSFTYDQTGQVTSMTDPLSNVTAYCFGDTAAGCQGSSTNAYVTEITYPNTGVAHVEKFSYYFASGELASSIDENNQATTYTYNDPFARLTQINYPDGGQTAYGYANGCTQPSSTTQLIQGSTYYTESDTTDGVCHLTQKAITSDPQGTDYTTTTYDGGGRVWTATNPYRSTSDSSYGVTTYTYDALGRTVSVLYPDSSTATTSYSINCTAFPGDCSTVTDAANKTRQLWTDGLGRLTAVSEDPYGLNYPTTYSYNALNDLLSVSQSGQPRNFAYDSLSRLLSATNPETGTTSYAYDPDGNVLSRTDARGVTTSYNCFGSSPIDSLNRVTCKSYSDGTTPTYTYQYDQSSVWGTGTVNANGHLTTETATPTRNIYNPTNQSMPYSVNVFYTYDPVGRLEVTGQCTPSTCGPAAYFPSYTYNYDGSLTSMSLSTHSSVPSMGQITYSYDAVNRLNSVTGSLPNQPTNLLSNFSYSAVGLTGVTMGNGIAETRSYNNRTWLSSLTSNPYNLSLSYYGNGDVYTANDSINGNWKYDTYDGVNRLQHADTTDGSNKSLTYGYDAYGNASCTAGSQNVVCHAYSFTTNPPTNQLSGYSYDQAGNLLSDGTCSYTYDGEERMNTATCLGITTTYLYDAEGRRIAKAVGSSTTEEYVYDLQGHLISAYGPYPSQTWLRSEVYAGNRHVATYTNGTTYFTQADWLGTERARTDVNANLCGTATSQPFGDSPSSWGCFTMSPHFFTGKQSDPETGMHYFGARFYSHQFYRFITPDWAAKATTVPYADFGNPQSLNLYGYAGNNPLSHSDPDGHGWWDEVKGVAVGTLGFAVSSAKGIAISAIPLYGPQKVGDAIGTAIVNAGQDYISKGVSGVANEVLDQGEQGAMEVVTGAVLAGAAAATSRLSGLTPGGSTSGSGLADSALVVRGGVPTAANLTKSAETIAPDGTLSGVSVNSANGATVQQLSAGIPNKQIGVTTVGNVRAIGGDVVRDPLTTNPNHCLMCNVDAGQASGIFQTQPNPANVQVNPQ
jgi:RHS repeat-associated protein